MPAMLNTTSSPILSAEGKVRRNAVKLLNWVCCMILNQRTRGLSLSGCCDQNTRSALREMTCINATYLSMRYVARRFLFTVLSSLTRFDRVIRYDEFGNGGRAKAGYPQGQGRAGRRRLTRQYWQHFQEQVNSSSPKRPALGHSLKFRKMFRPVMQGSWIPISPVRPYQSMDLRVNLNLAE